MKGEADTAGRQTPDGLPALSAGGQVKYFGSVMCKGRCCYIGQWFDRVCAASRRFGVVVVASSGVSRVRPSSESSSAPPSTSDRGVEHRYRETHTPSAA